MLRYLDSRYADIIGYQDLCRYLQHFPRFNEAIEDFVTLAAVADAAGVSHNVPGASWAPFHEAPVVLAGGGAAARKSSIKLASSSSTVQ